MDGKTISLKEAFRVLTRSEMYRTDVFPVDDFVQPSQKKIFAKMIAVRVGSDHSPTQICRGTAIPNAVSTAAYDLIQSFDNEIRASRRIDEGLEIPALTFAKERRDVRAEDPDTATAIFWQVSSECELHRVVNVLLPVTCLLGSAYFFRFTSGLDLFLAVFFAVAVFFFLVVGFGLRELT